MNTKNRKTRQQIRDQLIAERLEKIGDRVLLNEAEPTKQEQEEAAKCSAESYKKK